MALSVTNDLQAPLEVKLQGGEWKVVYPQKSFDVGVSGETSVCLVEVRLRESPELRGSCQAANGSSELRASVDFEAFSRQARGRDRAEARELAREGKRREEARMRTEAMVQEAAAKKRNELAFVFAICWAIVMGLPLVLLVVCSAIPPESPVAAALLASATIPLCCFIGVFSVLGSADSQSQFLLGKYRLVFCVGFRLAGLLALLSLAAMTAQHILEGYWWTALIVWPVAVFGGVWFCCFKSKDLDGDKKDILRREREEAQGEVSNRTIRFEGSVLRERGRPCVASWPGKYEGAWEALVSQGRKGEVSAAVVFLPQGTDDYGKHDSIPLAEGLPGTCWCTPLYGEQRPWGCRWFTKWRENIETAVESGAELEVYYFQGHVGKGKVENFGSAGKTTCRGRRRTRSKKRLRGVSRVQAGAGRRSRQPLQQASWRRILPVQP